MQRKSSAANKESTMNRIVRISLATGLHVIAAHNRRHLWQAWRVRKAAEQVRRAEH